MKKLLLIDRDGTLIKEVPPTYMVDSFDKLEFYPFVFTWMSRIATELDYELVMITNQDGLGTDTFPEILFQPVHEFIMKSLANEGIHFSEVLIDRTFPHENAATRKPGTGLLLKYINNPGYDIGASFVIGDRITDVQLAKNLDCKAIWLNNSPGLGDSEVNDNAHSLQLSVALETTDWKKIYEFLKKVSETHP